MLALRRRYPITVMINSGMAKKSATPPDAPAKRRGRPPKPGGRIPQVEVQRAYRARLAAAGKVVRIVDAAVGTVPIPDFDPATDGVFEREMIAGMREKLRIALSERAYLKDEVGRLRERNAALEADLKTQERHHTNVLKDNVVLKRRLERLERAPAKRRGGSAAAGDDR